MAEFFVLRKYRRRGIGLTAAHQVISRFPGSWEVRYMTSNGFAVAFWPHVIEELTSNSFTGYDEPGWPWTPIRVRKCKVARMGFDRLA